MVYPFSSTSAMREGSREQAGCFVAVLMVATAGFAVRAALRVALWSPGGSTVTPVRLAMIVGLAIVFVICSLFALKLRKWALMVYGIASLIGIGLSLYFELQIAVPLTIGLGAVIAVAWVRRDVF